MSNDFRRPSPVGCSPARLQIRVVVGVSFDGLGPEIHVRDGLLRIFGVFGDIPGQRHHVGGQTIVQLLRASIVRFFEKPAFHRGSRTGRASEGSKRVVDHRLVRFTPWLGTQFHIVLDEVELCLIQKDAGVDETLGCLCFNGFRGGWNRDVNGGAMRKRGKLVKDECNETCFEKHLERLVSCFILAKMRDLIGL